MNEDIYKKWNDLLPDSIRSATFLMVGSGETYDAVIVRGSDLLAVYEEQCFGGKGTGEPEQMAEACRRLLDTDMYWYNDTGRGPVRWKEDVGETDRLEFIRITEKVKPLTLNGLADLIIETLREHGESLLTDDGVDGAISKRIAEQIISATPWVPVADYYEIQERMKNFVEIIHPFAGKTSTPISFVDKDGYGTPWIEEVGDYKFGLLKIGDHFAYKVVKILERVNMTAIHLAGVSGFSSPQDADIAARAFIARHQADSMESVEVCHQCGQNPAVEWATLCAGCGEVHR